jgi:hypothetical protein
MMSTAILDEKLIPILESATDRVEIQDRNGDTIGYFEPVKGKNYVRQSPYSIEEIRAIPRDKTKGMSLEEALKRIGAQ